MNEDGKLKAVVQKILNLVPNAPEKFGSVIAVLMMISIVLTLIRIIQQCHKNRLKLFKNNKDKCEFYNAEIKDLSLSRSWFTKRTIKKLLKKELSEEDYDHYGVSLMNAILECGTNLTEEETFTLVEAANV